jgi:drug/metabolite transporter (DMT)-like permease
MSPSLPLLALIGASVLWGLTWLPLKVLGKLGVSGPLLAGLAFGAAGLVLLPHLLGQRRQWRGRGGGLLLIALLGGYANVAFAVAMMQGEVVRVMVLFYLLPVWGVLGGRLFLGESLDRIRVSAAMAALAGALLIVGQDGGLLGALRFTDVLAITCGMSFAGNNLVFRARQELPVASKVAAMLLGAGLIGWLAIPFDPHAGLPLTVTATAWTLAYGVGWLLVATIGTQYGVTHMEAGRASVIIILELVTAVVSAVLIGGETLSIYDAAGGMLIITAAIVEARRPG